MATSSTILKDKTQPRLDIAHHSDGPWIRDAGRQLADFLSHPFFDRQARVLDAAVRGRRPPDLARKPTLVRTTRVGGD